MRVQGEMRISYRSCQLMTHQSATRGDQDHFNAPAPSAPHHAPHCDLGHASPYGHSVAAPLKLPLIGSERDTVTAPLIGSAPCKTQ